MVRFAKIKRMISAILAEVSGLGGATQNRMVSVKGIYSKPKGENAIVIPLSQGNNQDVIFVLQKEVELDDGDVYVTDDKSYIHFHFNGESIELKTKDLLFDVEKFKVKAKDVEFDIDNLKVKSTSNEIISSETKFTGGTVRHDGIPMDRHHYHLKGGAPHTQVPSPVEE